MHLSQTICSFMKSSSLHVLIEPRSLEEIYPSLISTWRQPIVATEFRGLPPHSCFPLTTLQRKGKRARRESAKEFFQWQGLALLVHFFLHGGNKKFSFHFNSKAEKVSQHCWIFFFFPCFAYWRNYKMFSASIRNSIALFSSQFTKCQEQVSWSKHKM